MEVTLLKIMLYPKFGPVVAHTKNSKRPTNPEFSVLLSAQILCKTNNSGFTLPISMGHKWPKFQIYNAILRRVISILVIFQKSHLKLNSIVKPLHF